MQLTCLKYLVKKLVQTFYLGLAKNLEIDLSNISAPLSEKLKNFKLLGKIENGKFTKFLQREF